MANSEQLVEIDERFCQCPICLEQYKDPKQLPCLHRYCRNCLEQLIEKNGDIGKITCPECREEFEIPEESVDGFKTDFYAQNVIDYIQLQKSLEDEQLKECCDCGRKIKVTAYCFKCNDFLCEECHSSHVTKKILKDHKNYTLSLEAIKSKSMTLEELVALKGAPRCQHHPENLSQLCCTTCDNLPICVTCTYGSHEHHNVKDFHILATDEKEKLNRQLEMLYQYKERMYKLSETVSRVKQDLICNVKKKKGFCHRTYETDVNKIENAMKSIEENRRVHEIEIRAKKERDLTEREKQMEKELGEIRAKYGSLCDEIRRENDDKLRDLNAKRDEQIKENTYKLRRVQRDLQNLMTSIDKRQKELEKKLEDISLHIDGAVKRFENLTTTARSILDAENDWAAVQSIPDIRTASEPLSVEMKREFPELETMAQIESIVEISQKEVSTIVVKGAKTSELHINGIATDDDGNVVITGSTSLYHSHITVINTEGKVLHQKEQQDSAFLSNRFCSYLSQFKIVTVCWINGIGVYDLLNHSYVKQNINDIISDWPENQVVMCVATDPVNNYIILGSLDGRDVYVLNYQLNYIHTMTLPDRIKRPYDMTVSNRSLLVCDRQGGNAYAVNIEGFDGKLLHEFKKPILDEDDWTPINVCTDKNMLVYMLWKGSPSNESRCLLVQYSQDGQQILTQRHVDSDARCVAVVETVQTEKLVIATEKKQKLYMYDIGKLHLL